MWYSSKLFKYFPFLPFLTIVIVVSVLYFVCPVSNICLEYSLSGWWFLWHICVSYIWLYMYLFVLYIFSGILNN
jgi:hypothetical protein